MNAKVIDQFVQVPYLHYRDIAAAIDSLVNHAGTLLFAIENPGFFTQQKLLTEILPACKQAIQVAQAEANIGEIREQEMFSYVCFSFFRSVTYVLSSSFRDSSVRGFSPRRLQSTGPHTARTTPVSRSDCCRSQKWWQSCSR